MEERKDVRGMIGAIDSGLRYAAIAGQVPWVHGCLMGSRLFRKLLAVQPFFSVPDPLCSFGGLSVLPVALAVHHRCTVADQQDS